MSTNVEASIRMPTILRTMAMMAAFSFAAGNARIAQAAPRVVIRNSEVFLIDRSGKSIQLTHDGKPKYHAKLIKRGKYIVYHGNFPESLRPHVDFKFTILNATDGKVQAEIPVYTGMGIVEKIVNLPGSRVGILGTGMRGIEYYVVLDVKKKKAVEVAEGYAVTLAPDRDTLIQVHWLPRGAPAELSYMESCFVGLTRISKMMEKPTGEELNWDHDVTWFWPRGYKLGDVVRNPRLSSSIYGEARFISKRKFVVSDETGDHRRRCLVFALPRKGKQRPKLWKIIPIRLAMYEPEIIEVKGSTAIVRERYREKPRTLKIDLRSGRIRRLSGARDRWNGWNER